MTPKTLATKEKIDQKILLMSKTAIHRMGEKWGHVFDRKLVSRMSRKLLAGPEKVFFSK